VDPRPDGVVVAAGVVTPDDQTLVRDWAAVGRRYVASFTRLLDDLDHEAIERVVERLRTARDNGATVFIAGNGGSASTASHWVNDLGKATKRSGRTPIKVMSLGDNVPWLTALGNDEGYERVFSGQLENFAVEGDVLMLISASGNSPNLIDAIHLARSRGMHTVGLLGFDGGKAFELCDDAVLLRTEIGEYGLVETGHSLVADIITTCLIEDVVEPSVDRLS
jgi:D-sedoheptulose 7-phosphate isomerase